MSSDGSGSGVPRVVVIGWPLNTTLSPVLHTHWLEMLGITGSYGAEPVPPAELEAWCARARKRLRGFNVTMPHKEAVARLCETRDRVAEQLQAVNTVVVQDGALHGYNTDVYGYRKNMERCASFAESPRDCAGILGAGGAARAVCAALMAWDYKRILIFNRTQERAQSMARALGLPDTCAQPLEAALDYAGQLDLCVNTIGPGGYDSRALVQSLPGHGIVSDIVYHPRITPILAQASARGLTICDGLGMLAYQAVPGFMRWFEPPEAPVVDEALLTKLAEALTP